VHQEVLIGTGQGNQVRTFHVPELFTFDPAEAVRTARR
jgi:hypothetical protein